MLAMDDARLNAWAAAHRHGDDDALRNLVEALTRPLLAMAYRYVGDWESARDLTQDTWLRVHRSIDGWDSSRPVRPWILAIHRNLCLDHLRARPRVEILAEEALDDVEQTTSDPWTNLTRGEFLDRIRDALSELSEAQRRVLTMVDLEEMRPTEVATWTGMNPNTVRTTLHFARRKLARILRKDLP